MQLTGILRTWHDDRGFGFIAPTHGGREVFVHASAFPDDGSRPVAGERLNYELASGRDGKPQAVRVTRLSMNGRPSSRPASAPPRRRLRPLLILALLAAAAVLAYARWRPATPTLPTLPTTPPPAEPAFVAPQPPLEAAPSPYRCDGRTHCSQMTSCAEATYFLRHCPGVEMDGDHDGIPCEQQWCTSPLTR